jgi:hypothetical protein
MVTKVVAANAAAPRKIAPIRATVTVMGDFLHESLSSFSHGHLRENPLRSFPENDLSP